MVFAGLTEAVRERLLTASPSVYSAVLVGLAVFAITVRQVAQWYRLSHVPGPFWMAMSNIPMIRISMSGKYSDRLMELTEKYGPVVRTGPQAVMIGDAETLKRISGLRSDYVKGDFYECAQLSPPQDTLFSMRDEERRRALKIKMTPGYSGREFGGFEPGIDKFINQLVDLVDAKYISTPESFRPIEWGHKAQFFTLDVISYLGFGEAFGFLDKDEDLYRYMEISDGIFPVMIVFSNLIWLARMMHRWPLLYLLPNEGNKVGFGRLMGFAKSFVDERLKPGANPGRDIMQTHINNGLSRDELIQDVFLILLAGSETTATAIRMTLLSLVATPKVTARLQAEIDEALRNGTVPSSPPGTIITDAQARSLPYLQAVVQEGLRIHTPVTGLMHKQVPRGGDVVHGIRLPEGTQVGTNIRAITRDKAVFGPDAEVFRPERWLEAEAATAAGEPGAAERYTAMREAVELVFGWGKFVCLGRPLALMELNKVFFELLRRYDFALVNPAKPLMAFNAGLWVINDYWLRVTKRET